MAILLAAASAAFGQDSRGSITGHVQDPHGAAVAGAKVAITDIETNISTNLTTNTSGIYEGLSLPSGKYRITAESPGFKKFVRDGFTLPAATSITVDIHLQIGQISESITVTGEAPLLETDTITASRSFETKDMIDLPTPSANAELLAKIAPGVQSATGMNELVGGGTLHAFALDSNFFMAGSVGSPMWTIDGMVDTGTSRHIGYIPSTDIVSEIKVETANFDASVGQTSSMNVTMTSKSGSNQLHGSARYLYWDERWEALSFFQKQQYYTSIANARATGNTATLNSLLSTNPLPAEHDNNYGFTLSGPIYIPKIVNGKNKLFFLFNYTGDKSASSRTNTPLQTGTVPTMAERGGNFSDLQTTYTGSSSNAAEYQIYDPLSTMNDPSRPGHVIRTPFPGNILPASRMTSPISATYNKFLPAPDANPSSPATVPSNNDVWDEVTPCTTETTTSRIDYNLSDKHRFFFRYNRLVWNQINQDNTFDMIGAENIWRYVAGFTGNWTYTITPTLLLTTSIGTNYVEIGQGLKNQQNYTPSTVGFPTYMDTTPSGIKAYLPIVSISGYTIAGEGGSSIGGNPLLPSKNRVSSVKSDLTYIHGNHSIRFGGDVRQMFFSQQTVGNASGSFSFANSFTKKSDDDTVGGSLGLSYASFLLGIPTGMSIDNDTNFVFSNPYYGGYVQETWRATPKLTVNAGLRMEYELGARERFDRALGGFNPTAQLPISALAQTAYAAAPVTTVSPVAYTLPASAFVVQGGTLYPGLGGNTRRIWGDKAMWLPRFGAAYQLNPKTVLRAGYGVYYDTLNVNNQSSFDQSYYSVTTNTTLTNDSGVTWLTGNPQAGISPLTNPFPTLASGSRYVAPYGNSLGLMAKAGTSYTYPSTNAPHARNQRWRFGAQRQIGHAMVLDVAYAGQYNTNLNTNLNRDSLPAQYYSAAATPATAINSDMTAKVTSPFYVGNFTSLAAGNPALYTYMSNSSFFTATTIAKSQLLKPYPLMTGLGAGAYGAGDGLGSSYIHSLEVTFSRRFTKGLSITSTYAFNDERDRTWLENSFSTHTTEQLGNNSRPHRLTSSGVWELPFGKGHALASHGPLAYIFGGFELSLVYEFESGALVSFPNLFYYGDVHDVFNVKRNPSVWFNTSEFVRSTALVPNGYNIRMFPQVIDGLRNDVINMWHGNIMRNFKIKEKANLQLRMNMYDIFNRSEFNGPDATPTDSTFGACTTNFGSNRSIEIQGRITF
jgi:hypothetical protein